MPINEGEQMSVTRLEIAARGEGPYGVTVQGPDLWVTLVHAGAITHFREGSVRQFDLGAATSRPSVIVPTADGAVWFTRSGDQSIGRISPTGEVSAVPLPSGSPYGLCRGPGGLWFTVMDADRIGRLGLEGGITEYVIGQDPSFPAMITARGSEVWFTLNARNAIGRWANGAMTFYELPTEAAGPVGISAGPDVVWFTELLAGQLGRLDADGNVTEVPLPDRQSKPHAVVATTDGGCWATLWGSGTLVRLQANGDVVREYDLGAGSEPHGLALADDGSVWVALETGSLAHVLP